MAKYITNEEFFNQLNSCEYGRQYIELVTNPKNHLRKKEKGDNHHIYMKAICGENSHLVRLSYYNHCLAHLLLAKAGCELDAWWSHKALCVINKMSGKARYNNLTDLEKTDLELEGWAEAKKLANEKIGEFNKERYKDPEEREKMRKIMKEASNRPEVKEKKSKVGIERYKDPKEREKTSKVMKEANNRPEAKENASKAQIERYKDPKEREKASKGQIERYKDPEEREKMSKAQIERYKDPKEHEKMSKGQIERYKNPKEREKTGKALRGKNKGRIIIINENEPTFKMIFPVDLPYWESLGWHKKSA